MSLKLSVTNIYKSYNGKSVLKNCSVSFNRGGIYVLMGPNGSGKSTFLRMCALLESPDRGTVNYFSNTPLSPPLSRGELKGDVFSENNILKIDIELKRRITLVLPKAGIFNTTVFKNVAYGLKIRGIKPMAIIEKVNTMLEFVGLNHKKKHNALTLSSGETQRLGIARALVINPDVLFLDEPTVSVDEENTEIIENIILDLKKTGRSTVIVATHDTLQAERLSDKVLILRNGSFFEINP
ncbi:MAG: ATP-binding cassette domain-containing protein [Nitrospirota bacterium]